MNMPRAYGLRYTNSTKLDSQVLELPYNGDEISMFVFPPPNEIDGLSSLEDSLGAKSLGEVFRAVDYVDDVYSMQVSMPKFVLEQEVDLKETLTNVGIEDLFDSGKADLSGIDDTHNLVLNTALHKVNIVVNEEGTEGAAATA